MLVLLRFLIKIELIDREEAPFSRFRLHYPKNLTNTHAMLLFTDTFHLKVSNTSYILYN